MIKRIFSCLYFLVLSLNNNFFKYKIKSQFSFNSFVISVGNLSLGGAGKTPMVIYLSSLLSGANLKHSIISRGYKRKSRGCVLVSNQKELLTSIKTAGDEPFLLANSLPGIPVVVGNKKKALHLSYNTFGNQISILDDGYQSHQILKNLNILLVDVSLEIKDYRLFPLGFLREPVSAAKNADIIIFTKCNHASKDIKKIKDLIFSRINLKSSLIFDSDFLLKLKKYSFEKNCFVGCDKNINNNLVAFCGLASPNIFKQAIPLFCNKAFKTIFFKDHHTYTKNSVLKIKRLLDRSNCQTILTTKKDFYKIVCFFPNCDIFIVDVEHKLNNEFLFNEVLLKSVKN